MTVSDQHSELIALLNEASRHVDILSPDLAPSVLDHSDVVECLTALARRGRNTRIRLIAEQVRPLREAGHRLLALAERLPSAVTLHELRSHPEWPRDTAIMIDRSIGMAGGAEATALHVIETRARGRQQAERFDRLWLASVASPELRRL